MKPYRIASLSCSFNRKNKTVRFLESLISQELSGNIEMDVLHLDDSSTDGTYEFVAENFQMVSLLKGTGSLFWAGGMRKVWDYATKRGEYDLYLLFNDDVELTPTCVSQLVASYKAQNSPGNIIVGTTISSETKAITYGGMNLFDSRKPHSYRVIPGDNESKTCDLGNANIMLVDSFCVARIGIFSDVYTHGIADYDYTLRARKNGINVMVAPGYLGFCEYDHGKSWMSQNTSLKKRINYLYHPKGLAYPEYCYYISEHFPTIYKTAKLKLWLKTIFPFVYDWLK